MHREGVNPHKRRVNPHSTKNSYHFEHGLLELSLSLHVGLGEIHDIGVVLGLDVQVTQLLGAQGAKDGVQRAWQETGLRWSASHCVRLAYQGNNNNNNK